MKAYLVGGAVRDQILGYPVLERDWVVIGETPQSMVAQGFRPVGKDFPVFLHPETREEYALARTERKSGRGYQGFVVHTSPDITLEEDLIRRDLTINAMALDAEGNLYDPFGGARDLKLGCIRHISPAFAEDPVRILRVARFAARFSELGFYVSQETIGLMREMVADGEVAALVPERVWAELFKALKETKPSLFFRVLGAASALKPLFPEVFALFGVPQSSQYHPEVDAGIHTLLALDQAASMSASPEVCFAALLHDLGKGLTSPLDWPSHPDHEVRGLQLMDALCRRLKVPHRFEQLARKVMQYHGLAHRALLLSPEEVLLLFERLDLYRKKEDLEAFLVACLADARGCLGHELRPYEQAEWLRRAFSATQEAKLSPEEAQGLSGSDFGKALRAKRLDLLIEARRTFPSP